MDSLSCDMSLSSHWRKHNNVKKLDTCHILFISDKGSQRQAIPSLKKKKKTLNHSDDSFQEQIE